MTALANVTPLHSGIDFVSGEPVQAAQGATKLRLTRRGRVVFGGLATALVAGALALAAMLGATDAVASDSQSAQEFPYVLAVPGDSLWSIAAELDPAADPRDVVNEIVRLNQMSGSELQAGESFAVPLRYADSERAFSAAELDS